MWRRRHRRLCNSASFGSTQSSRRRRELLVRRDLDQIAVGIAAIDRDDDAHGAVLFAGPFLDGDAAAPEMVRHLLRRRPGQEAKVVAARRDLPAGEPLLLRRRLGPQVDLLPWRSL